MGAYLRYAREALILKKQYFVFFTGGLKRWKKWNSVFIVLSLTFFCGIARFSRGNKNKLRTFQPQKWKKIKNSQPQIKFTGSYKKKSVYLLLAKHFVSISLIWNYYVIRRANYFLCESSFSFLINRKLARGLCFLQTCEKFTSRKSSE